MNSEQIKAVLLSGDFAPVPAKFAYDYILALEAERDAWRKRAVPRDSCGHPTCDDVRCVSDMAEWAVIDAARARVDSFKPPAAPGEGEKA